MLRPDFLRAWQNLAAAAVSQADKMQAAHALIEKYDTDKVRAPPISSTRTIFSGSSRANCSRAAPAGRALHPAMLGRLGRTGVQRGER